MTHMLKRKHVPLTPHVLCTALALAFAFGAIVARSFVRDNSGGPSVSTIVISTDNNHNNKGDNLFTSWRNGRESCTQWVNAQRMSGAYLDAYIIGVQKGATSELCMRLGKLGVMPHDMEKEWHLFNHLVEPGERVMQGQLMTLHMPYTDVEMEKLKLKHYLAGFPNRNVSLSNVPLIDGSRQQERSLVLDSTVEYMLSDRAAFLAHALTPHAKIVLTLREPIDRAISQYNMMIRLFNQGLRKRGEKEMVATPQQFDYLVRREISRLKKCGYDEEHSRLDRPTSLLLRCMYDGLDSHGFDDLLYVARGIYHIHIDTWRNYFPDHRMHFVNFAHVSQGKDQVMQDLASFLCVKPFGQELLERYRQKGSSISFGRQAAEKGLEKMGFESYSGKDRYMTEILPSTRALLEAFYTPANDKLWNVLGMKMW